MTSATPDHPFWQRVLAREAAPEQDAADMGTCFGLEMSLGEPAPPCPETARARPSPLRTWLTRLRDDRRSRD